MLTVAEFNTTWSKNIVESYDMQSKEAIKNSAVSRIFDIVDTTEYTESFNTTEAMDAPGYFDEGETLKESSTGKGYKVTFDSREFGHTITVTKKARLKAKDSTEKLLEVINREKNNAITTMMAFIETEAHKIFNEAFSSTTYLAPDGLCLCNDAHAWKSTSATFDNLLSAGTVLSATVVDAAEKYAGAFTDAEGNAMPIMLNKILVKKWGTAAQAAKRLFGVKNSAGQYSPTSVGAINIYEGAYTIIETPYLTSDTAYFFLGDAEQMGIDNPLFINFMQRPQIEGEFTQIKNLNWEASVAASMKFGIRNLPVTVLGDDGAA